MLVPEGYHSRELLAMVVGNIQPSLKRNLDYVECQHKYEAYEAYKDEGNKPHSIRISALMCVLEA